jgi:hypothetical protein
MNQETLLMVYYAYFQSVLHYGIIFWRNSSYAINIFHVQKRTLRIMAGIGNRDSCRQLFKTLRILPLQSQYIYSLLCFLVNNMDSYQFLSDTHSRNTRHEKPQSGWLDPGPPTLLWCLVIQLFVRKWRGKCIFIPTYTIPCTESLGSWWRYSMKIPVHSKTGVLLTWVIQ